MIPLYDYITDLDEGNDLVIEVEYDGDQNDWPDWITYDPDTNEITFDEIPSDEKGPHDILIKVSDAFGGEVEIPFSL